MTPKFMTAKEADLASALKSTAVFRVNAGKSDVVGWRSLSLPNGLIR